MPRKTGSNYYTQLWDGQIRGLTEAGASGNERAAYEFATRFHGDATHPARFWVNADMAADKIGMRSDVFARALRDLCKKCFYIGGRPVPILTKVARGQNGHSARYNDNLYQAVCLERTYPTSSKAELPAY